MCKANSFFFLSSCTIFWFFFVVVLLFVVGIKIDETSLLMQITVEEGSRLLLFRIKRSIKRRN